MALFADLTELQSSEVADNDFLLIYARSLQKARKVKAKAFRQGEVESVNGKKGAVQLKMPDVVNVGDNLSYNEQTNTLSADAQEITVDSELSGTSTNPVQNKVVKGALDAKVNNNDSRLTDARPASDVYDWAKAATKPSYNANEVGAIPSAQKGAANGVATLDENGKVPSSQLPSYVDDVLEYASLPSFPSTGESGKIYIAQDTNKNYRWSGTKYAEISESLALGETSSTAFAGNRGKAIEDKIPSNASSSNKLVSQSDLSNATVAKAFTGIFGMLGGANQISANTIDGLIAEVTGAESGGGICGGSVSLSASRGVPAGWHNFLYIPHRTGRGSDNYLYGTLFIIPMTENSESFYVVHYIGGNIYDAKRFRYDYTDNADTVDGYHVGDAIYSLVSAVRGTDGGQDGGGGCQACMTNQNFDGEYKWWHKLSMDWYGNDPTNWISQLFLPTQEGGVPKYRRNDSSDVGITQSTMHDFITDENIQSILDNYTFGHKPPVRVQCNTEGWYVINGVFLIQKPTYLENTLYYPPQQGSTPSFDTATPPPLNITLIYENGNYETIDVVPSLLTYKYAVSLQRFLFTKTYSSAMWVNDKDAGNNYYFLDYDSNTGYCKLITGGYSPKKVIWCYLPSVVFQKRFIHGETFLNSSYEDCTIFFDDDRYCCFALYYTVYATYYNQFYNYINSVEIRYSLTDHTYYDDASQKYTLTKIKTNDIERIPSEQLMKLCKNQDFWVYTEDTSDGQAYFYNQATKTVQKTSMSVSKYHLWVMILDARNL